jgi:ABC-type amino acid transport substrate-binding protein
MRFIRLAKLGSVLVLAAMAFVAQAQEDAIYDHVMQAKELRVFAPDTPPQSWRDVAADEWKGFDADIYRYVGQRLNVKVTPVWVSLEGSVPALTSGRADMGTALFRTPEREKLIDFTIPYKWINDSVIVWKDNNTIKSMADLKGKTLGVVRGTSQEIASNKMREQGLIGDVRMYDTVNALYADLKARRVEAIAYGTIYHLWVESQDPAMQSRIALQIPPEYFGRSGAVPSQFPLRKGASKLAGQVNNIITEMRENGTMAKIFAKYGITDPSVWTQPAK